MILWLDAQLAPFLAPWINESIPGVQAFSLTRLGLRDSEDSGVFMTARAADVIVITKDADFVDLLMTHGPPPKVIWLTCGNTSNAFLRKILLTRLPMALEILSTQEPLVEIR